MKLEDKKLLDFGRVVYGKIIVINHNLDCFEKNTKDKDLYIKNIEFGVKGIQDLVKSDKALLQELKSNKRLSKGFEDTISRIGNLNLKVLKEIQKI